MADDMTPNQLRAALDRLGLTQVGAARLLGIDPRTMRRYCSGTLPIPKWMTYALAVEQIGASVYNANSTKEMGHEKR